MHTFRDLKVRWKIILPYTLLMFLIVGFILLRYVFSETERLKTDQSQKMEIVIQELAEASSHPLAVREYNRLQTLLVHLKGIDTDIQYVTLVDNEGQSLTSTDVDIQGKTLSIERPVNARDLPSGVTQIEFAEGKADYELRSPVKLFDIAMGELRIGVSRARIYDAIREFVVINGVIGLAAVIVGILVFEWVIRIGVNWPIQDLADAAAQIAGGDLNQKVPVRGEDEIGELGRAFNEMTERLQATVGVIQERSLELEASQRITFAVSERASPDALLDMVVNLVRDQFHLYHAQVYIVDRDKGAAVLRKSTGYAGRQLLARKHHIPLDHPALVTKAIHEGEPVLVADVSEDPNFLPNPLLPETRSELVVPMKLGEEVIGVLDAQDRTPGRFSESTVALFQTMVAQVAMLFESSELIERTAAQTETLTAFTTQLRTAADIAGRLAVILDPERLLQQVAELVRSRMGFYHAHIYVLDEGDGDGRGHLVVRAGSGDVGRVLRERGHSIPLEAEKSLVARAAREAQAVVVEDTSLAPDFMPNPLLPQTRSELAVPLVAGDELLGVLDVQDDQPGRFTQADVDTFTTLAGQAAVALQNARLFEEQQRAEQAAREREEQFRTLVEHAPEAIVVLDADTGRFVDVNENAVKLYGLEREELLKVGPVEMSPPTQPDGRPSAEAAVSEIQKAVEGGTPVFEWMYRNAAGDDIPCEVRLVRLPAAGRNLLRGSVADITERKRAQEEQQKLVALVENSSDFIALATFEGQVLYMNEAGRALVGLESLEEAMRTVIPDYFTPEDLAYVQREVLPVVMEQGRWEGEVHFRHFKTGERIPVYYNVFTVVDSQTGRPLGLATVTRALRKQKRA